jgi:SAM-dependent methyltransferase
VSAEPDFGNWLRLRRIVTLLGSGAMVGAGAIALPSPWCWAAALIGLTAFATGLFLLYVYYQFHDRGGGVQRRLWRLTLNQLHGYGELSGTALDIGTGNGSLAVISAMENPALEAIGIDLWAPEWEYSIDDCRDNSERGGVTGRCRFERASADELPFPDETFDYVMSHFVFHEVRSATDKRSVIREALRVLKKGGSFSFHDMFFDSGLYGRHTDLVDSLLSTGIDHVRLVDTWPLVQAPALLMGKRILGHCAILCGRK